MIWLLLGAIIDPNVFLVYTSSVSVLFTFISQQLAQAESVAKEA